MVHIKLRHIKKLKAFDDNNPNKNDCKDLKKIAALVNERIFSYLYIPNGIYVEIRNLSNFKFVDIFYMAMDYSFMFEKNIV